MSVRFNFKDCAIFGVDLQNCFGHSQGGLYVGSPKKILKQDNKLVSHAKRAGSLIIFSADWHPPDSDHFQPIGPWPPHGIAYTWDAEFLSGLNISPGSIILYKGTEKTQHGYDPFEGKTKNNKTTREVLDKNKVTKIVFWGIATNYCVKAGVLTACKLEKYKVYLALDACLAINTNPGDEQKAIDEMKKAGAIITSVKEIINGK